MTCLPVQQATPAAVIDRHMRRLNRLLCGAPQAYWGRIAGAIAGPGAGARAARAAAAADMCKDLWLENHWVDSEDELLRRQSRFVAVRAVQGVAEADALVRRAASPARGWAALVHVTAGMLAFGEINLPRHAASDPACARSAHDWSCHLLCQVCPTQSGPLVFSNSKHGSAVFRTSECSAA